MAAPRSNKAQRPVSGSDSGGLQWGQRAREDKPARRHPEKVVYWIKDRYFKVRGSRKWVFAASEKQDDGKDKDITLLKESDTPIQRHVKIKANANPHDPEWEPYFAARWCHKRQNSARGMAKFYRVWQSFIAYGKGRTAFALSVKHRSHSAALGLSVTL